MAFPSTATLGQVASSRTKSTFWTPEAILLTHAEGAEDGSGEGTKDGEGLGRTLTDGAWVVGYIVGTRLTEGGGDTVGLAARVILLSAESVTPRAVANTTTITNITHRRHRTSVCLYHGMARVAMTTSPSTLGSTRKASGMIGIDGSSCPRAGLELGVTTATCVELRELTAAFPATSASRVSVSTIMVSASPPSVSTASSASRVGCVGIMDSSSASGTITSSRISSSFPLTLSSSRTPASGEGGPSMPRIISGIATVAFFKLDPAAAPAGD
mmetsp:Transcript_25654/g.54550  ORF Transcript_25654/g.54550 Transcript_25654/m.54550 type:complete len:271 (+) Transcript_25654:1169-1981(+)